MRILCACCPGRMRRRYQPAFRCKPSQVSMKYSYFLYKLRHVYGSRVGNMRPLQPTSSLFRSYASQKNPSTGNNPVGGSHKLLPSHVPRFYLGECNGRSLVFVFDSAKARSILPRGRERQKKRKLGCFKASCKHRGNDYPLLC